MYVVVIIDVPCITEVNQFNGRCCGGPDVNQQVFRLDRKNDKNNTLYMYVYI